MSVLLASNISNDKTSTYIHSVLNLKMIKCILLLAMLVSVAVAQQDSTNPPVEIITESSFVDEKGYHFEFKTSDGTSRKEEAQLITVGEHQGIGVRGSYSYIAPDGQEYLVTFTADENGFKPTITLSNSENQQS